MHSYHALHLLVSPKVLVRVVMHMQECTALTSRALLCSFHCWLTTVWQCAVAATTSCQYSPACNIMLSATLGMSPVSSPVSSLQILITSLAIYFTLCQALVSMHMPWATSMVMQLSQVTVLKKLQRHVMCNVASIMLSMCICLLYIMQTIYLHV